MKLTKEIAFEELQNFFQEKPFVLFGTGMSMAVNPVFGMNALKNYLLANIKEENLEENQITEWNEVKESLNKNNDFESAMNNVKDKALINKIVELTGNFVAEKDFLFSQKILSGEIEWPASSLFKKLVNSLPGTDRKLHIATPNYDMLAETAFFKTELPYINGFWGGIARRLDWKQSARAITFTEKVPRGRTSRSVTRNKKHIVFYKVHGSLNLFLLNDLLIENNAWLYKKPDVVERLIITPGISKYEKLHRFRTELLGKYDEAIQKHNFFLFLGFGFNDNQLNTHTILEKLKNKKANGIIITKSSNRSIENLLNASENLWLVCESEDKNATIIRNNKFSDVLKLENEYLWKVDMFTNKILGE